MPVKTEMVYPFRLPSCVMSTLSLMRRRLHVSREMADDVVRARGRLARFASSEVSLFDNIWHGRVRAWHENSGTLSWECIYVKGLPHGHMRRWHNNGALCVEIPYVNGKVHGIRRKWYDNGARDYEIPHVDDHFHGLARWWNPDSCLQHEEFFYKRKTVSQLGE